MYDPDTPIEITYLTHEELKSFYPSPLEKECNTCHDVRPIEDFPMSRRCLDGHLPKCRECLSAYKKDWRIRFRESCLVREQAYYVNNKQKVLFWRKKRELTKRAIPSSFITEEWEDLKVYYDNSCAYCGNQVEQLEIEHMMPLSRGGHHVKENIVPSCKDCNLRKGKKTVEEIGYTLMKIHPFNF